MFKPVERSLDWLGQVYIEHLRREVEAALKSPLTLAQRRQHIARLCAYAPDGLRYGTYDLRAPRAAFVRLRDDLISTPSEANNTIKSLRAMYSWAVDVGIAAENPLIGIKPLAAGQGGAVPWTAEDLRAYRKFHAPGTMAHLALTQFMFTGCRIGDAVRLGRQCEAVHDGQTYLEWQPEKRGSAPVSMPMLEPYKRATRQMAIIGPTYILNAHGRPFKSGAVLGNRFRAWCHDAGLKDRSAHGIRKALAALLSELGVPDQNIGAVLAHTNVQTTAIYTRARRRRIMSARAMKEVSEALSDW